jgi:hypothetical protein
MADMKAGEPFGLDTAVLTRIDWPLARERVIHDLRSDFIYAPHLSFIYSEAGDELIAFLDRELRSGTFSPGVPLTIETRVVTRAGAGSRFGGDSHLLAQGGEDLHKTRCALGGKAKASAHRSGCESAPNSALTRGATYPLLTVPSRVSRRHAVTLSDAAPSRPAI